MKHSNIKLALLGIFVAAAMTSAHSDTKATAAEATTMVKKGVAFIKANGKDKGHAEISNKSGQFNDRDL